MTIQRVLFLSNTIDLQLFAKFWKNLTKLRKFLVPDDYLSLDETLCPTRTQISFKQFIPSKPAKYGMLSKSINAFCYPFTFSTAVYPGKPKAKPTFYYTLETSQTLKCLIQNLECHKNLVARNILYDRLYTSIPMVQWLLDRGITSVGTLQSNRKGIPAEIKEIKDRETNSHEIYWKKDDGIINLHSCRVKTKISGKRNVLLLSTVPPLLATTKDDNKSKPAIYKLYDFSKHENRKKISKR